MADVDRIKRNIGRMIDQGAAETEIDQYVASEGASVADLKPGPSVASQAADIPLSLGTGVARGAIGLAGLPGDIQGLAAKGAEAMVGPRAPPLIPGAMLPGSRDIQGAIEGVTGPFRQPQTPLGHGAQTVGEFLPGAATGPGGLARKLIQYGVIPGAISEMAGQQYKGQPGEPYARAIGGLAGVGVGKGVGTGIGGIRNRLATGQTAGEISDIIGQPVGPGATRRIAGSIEADRLTPAMATARTGELGNEAMLLDLGRQLRGRGEAVAAQPGRGQSTVLDAVEGRTGRFGQGTADRVAQTLDREMGPTQNVVQLENSVNAVVDRIARPLYRQVMDAYPVVNVPFAISGRPAIAAAMKNAKTLAKQYGENISGTTETTTILSGPGFHIAEDTAIPAKTSLKYWDYVKKDMDRRINSYMKSGGTSELNSADKADLGGLMDARRTLVDHLDTVTQGAYKDARQAAATKYELREALDFGRTAFNSKLLPEEFAESLAGMSVPERAMAQAGFRRELDRLIETTRNEGATARRVLDTNHVLQKTEMLFGPQAARQIEARIGAENTFQEATQDIARNSRTAVRQQLIKDTSTPSSAEIRGTSFPGLAWAAGRGGLNYIRQHGMENTRGQIADVLTAGGPQIDPLMQAFARLNARRAQNMMPVGNAPLSGINALISGTTPERLR